MAEAPATILGGLPVIAEVSFGKDSDTPSGPGDYWAEVENIYWMKRDGSKGREIPKHLWDRAEKYDRYFGSLTEQVSDHLAHEAWLEKHGGVEPPLVRLTR